MNALPELLVPLTELPGYIEWRMETDNIYEIIYDCTGRWVLRLWYDPGDIVTYLQLRTGDVIVRDVWMDIRHAPTWVAPRAQAG